MDNSYYTALDRDIRDVVSDLGSYSDAEKNEVLHFVDVQEYGIALETLIAISVDEKRKISPDVSSRIELLFHKMGMRAVADSNGET